MIVFLAIHRVVPQRRRAAVRIGDRGHVARVVVGPGGGAGVLDDGGEFASDLVVGVLHRPSGAIGFRRDPAERVERRRLSAAERIGRRGLIALGVVRKRRGVAERVCLRCPQAAAVVPVRRGAPEGIGP